MLRKLGRIPVPWSGFCLLSRQAGWVETVGLVLYEMEKPRRVNRRAGLRQQLHRRSYTLAGTTGIERSVSYCLYNMLLHC
jgi:hypothetical protein